MEFGDGFFIHVEDTLAFYSSTGGYGHNLIINIKNKEYKFFRQNYSEIYNKLQYFYYNGKNILYSDNYNDTIFQFQKGTLQPSLYIDFKKRKLPKKFRNQRKIGFSNYCYDLGDIKSISRFLFFSFVYQQTVINGIKDKNTETLYLAKKFNNDIDNIPFLLYPNCFHDTTKIITAIDAPSLIEIYEYNQKRNKHVTQIYHQMVKQINENSNPIIVFAYLKK